ncbi:hypothetical protein THAOC_26607 [Thalassiosira oceanica]|uniref:Uncharacterized protein n=1 Tax=Thalassiosira oceanica TaxID=159749 RepID=K0S4P3_THAOC|nr:hypothetical protein THAOC_26607 [Thalassiosira oceanica]|eukprot:EJK53872.1 hypothetical protein THAOC_26607 [Thalassiosira oceanica]
MAPGYPDKKPFDVLFQPTPMLSATAPTCPFGTVGIDVVIPSTPQLSPPRNSIDVIEKVSANAEVHHQSYERQKLGRDGVRSEGDAIIGELLSEGHVLIPFAVDRWLRWYRAHGSTIPVWRATPSGTNFPSGQTQRHSDVCASLSPPGTARCRHSCLHAVEAEPNSGFLRSLVHGPHPARILAPAARTLFHQSLRDPHSELVPEAHAATLTYSHSHNHAPATANV